MSPWIPFLAIVSLLFILALVAWGKYGPHNG